MAGRQQYPSFDDLSDAAPAKSTLPSFDDLLARDEERRAAWSGEAFREAGGPVDQINSLAGMSEAERAAYGRRVDRQDRDLAATMAADTKARAEQKDAEGDTWAETGRKFVNRIVPLIQQSAAGTLQALIETGGAPPETMPLTPQERADWQRDYEEVISAAAKRGAIPGQKAYAAATADLEANGYNPGDSTAKKYVAMIAEAGVQMVPTIAATIATRNPTIGAATMFPQVAGQQYGESRMSGRDVGASTADAVFMGVAETLGEKIPLGMIIKPGGKFLSSTLKTAGAEGLQEMFTQVLQTGYDKGVLHPDMTWGEAVEQVRDAGIVGFGLGGGMAIAARPFNRKGDVEAAVEAASQPTPEDIASPIPTETIIAGKQSIARTEAEAAGTDALKGLGLPGVGSRVQLDMGNGRTAAGVMQDTFTHTDNDLGAEQGIRIAMDDGTTFEEFISSIQRGGMRITPEVAAPVIGNPMSDPQPVLPTAEELFGGAEIPGAPAPALPVQGGRITSGYGQREAPMDGASTNHRGIDIAAPVDSPVQVMGPGKVISARFDGPNGNIVRVQHADGYVSSYAHLNGFDVKAGDEVRAGQQIGRVGATGRTTGPHLHYAVKKDGEFVDPNAVSLVAPGGQVNLEPGSTFAAEGIDDASPDLNPADFIPPENTRLGTAEEITPAPQETAENRALASPEEITPAQPSTATVEKLTDKSVIVRGASPEQVAAIRAALPEKVAPIENKAKGGLVFAAKHADKINAALADTPSAGSNVAPEYQPLAGNGSRVAITGKDGTERVYEVANASATTTDLRPVDGQSISTNVGTASLNERVRAGTAKIVDADYSPKPAPITAEEADISIPGRPAPRIEKVERAPKAAKDDGWPVDQPIRNLARDDGRFAVRGGAQLTTQTGRTTSRAPMWNDATPQTRKLSLNRQEEWLLKEAIDEASQMGSPSRNALPFLRSMRPGNMSRSDHDTVNDVLFGDYEGPKDAASLKTDRPPVKVRKDAPTPREAPQGRADGLPSPYQETEDGEAPKPRPVDRSVAIVMDPAKGTTKAVPIGTQPEAVRDRIMVAMQNSTPDRVERVARALGLDNPAKGDETWSAYTKRVATGAHAVSALENEWAASKKEESPASPPKAEPDVKAANYGAANKLVTTDRAAELRARLKSKFNQLNSGVDPEMLALGTELAVYHIEAGARKFADFARTMADDLGQSLERLRPFLRGWYNGARDMMEDQGIGIDGMQTPDEVRTEMAALYKPQEKTDGLQGDVSERPARAEPRDVQRASEDGGAGRARPEEERGGAQDGGRTDRRPAEVAERPAEGSDRTEGGRGAGAVNADRVPSRRAVSGDGRRADTGTGSRDRVSGANWRIEPGSQAEDRAASTKARDNIRAIEIVAELNETGMPATIEQQAALARYVGWGGLKNAFPRADGTYAAGFETIGPRVRELLNDEEYDQARRSIQYAHYTSEQVVRPMWDAARRFGFTGGKVFEPGVGIGNFIGMMPADMADRSAYSGIEYDATTARIAALLYPNSGIQHADYTRTPMPADFYDLVIGNPPFSETVVQSDPAYKQGFMLHDYFFAKSIDAVRPGGLLMFITSAGTMNKINAKAREYLAERADFVGAVRLPGNAFEQNAGTGVTTDIIVLRKLMPGEAVGNTEWTVAENRSLPDRDGGETVVSTSRYFNTHPEQVLGVEGAFDKLVAGNRYAVRARPGADLPKEIAAAFERLPAGVMTQPTLEPAGNADFEVGQFEAKDGSFFIRDGKLYQQRGAVAQAVQARGKGVEGGIPAADQERIRALIPIRDSLREVYAHDLAGNTAKAEEARASLNRAYDTFVQQHGPINKAVISFRRPNVIQQESARSAAREEVRLSGRFFSEGDFDPSDLIDSGASLREVAAARRYARETAAALGREFDEGDFDPADMPDIVVDKRPNIDPFMDDQEGYRLRAIEHYDDDTGEAKKGLVFFENVVSKDRAPQIKGAGDALLYVLNKTGRPDIAQIADLAGMSQTEVIDALGDSIFQTPDGSGSWQTREQYLSGNVRQKLANAQAAAAADPAFARNVTALEAVQPPDLSPGEISINLGMPWLPPRVIETFGKEALGLSTLSATYRPGLAQWIVSGDTSSAASTSVWGTSSRNAVTLISDALNRTDPKIYRKYRDAEGREKSEIDPEATQAAQDKVREIKEKFRDWVYTDTARADELAGIYNRDFNNLVAPEYDGSYLTTPGISSTWSWRPHQTRVIARIIQSGNTYMAHAVGAGKTSAMIGAGMEMRRLGLARKPMYVVPNHMLGQFTKEFYEQYPTARIAVADERRFHTDKRKQFVANIAAEDLDAVIITHSAFGIIPISDKFRDTLIERELDDYRAMMSELKLQGADRVTQRRVEQGIESLEQKLSGKTSGKKKDAVFTFEETGVDFLFVDEAHLFRKLDFATKMGNVKGIDPQGSAASYDLFAKTRYLEQRNPGRSHVLASGTPITNTMAELYSLSRYLQSDELAKRGIAQFDAWAGAFGDTVTALEQDPAGGYKPQTRFAKFLNIPELSSMVRQVMDVVTSNQLAQYVTRPKLRGGERQMIIADRDDQPALLDYVEALAARMRAIEKRKGPPQKGDDIMLSVIGDGRKAAIDMRLVDPSIKLNPETKLEKLIDNVAKIARDTKRTGFHAPGANGYSEKPVEFGPATQMVFSDLGINGEFPVHKYIQAQVAARAGIPKSQVAIISDFKSHVARQRLFNDMNEGKVRVLIGSVPKMGTGVNAQRRLYAIHNLDPQWYPANDEQRNGRGIRQGNMNPEIGIYDYSTKGTYDSQMWQLMANKARFIEGFMSGDPTLRDMEDLGEASQYEQAKALTTADPRIMELTEWKQELERMTRREAAFEREQYAIRRRIADAENRVQWNTDRIPEIEADIAQRVDIKGDAFAGKVGDAEFTDRTEWGEAVLARLDELASEGMTRKGASIGEVGGFQMAVDFNWGFGDKAGGKGLRPIMYLRLNGDQEARVEGTTARGIAASVATTLGSFEGALERTQARIEDAQKEIADYTPELGKKFDGGAAIEELSGKIDTLESQLEAESKEPRAMAAPKKADDDVELADSFVPSDEDIAAIETELRAELVKAGIDGKVSLAISKGMLGSAEHPATGMYWPGMRLIEVAADADSPVQVLDHEIIHFLRDVGAIRPDEWSALVRGANLEPGLMDGVRMRWGDGRYEARDLEAMLEEEAVAELYRISRDNERYLRGRIGQFGLRVFDRIAAILRTIARFFSGKPRPDGPSYMSVINAIQSGEIGARVQPGASRGGGPMASAAPREDHSFSNPEIEERFKNASLGLADRSGMIARTKDWLGEKARGFSRTYKDLPNEARFSDVKQQLRKLQAASTSSQEKVIRILTRMVDGMSADQYDLFRRKVMLDDLAWEAAEGRQLPFGFTERSLTAEKAVVDAKVAADPKVETAVRQRKLTNDRIARDMVDAGVLDPEQVKNPAYFRHQVLEYALMTAAAARKGGSRLRTPKWAKRMGSSLDINANLLEAEFEWMHKALTDIETARTIEWIKKSEHNIRPELLAAARAANKEAIDAAIAKDLKENGPDGPIVSASKAFAQRIAIGMSSVQAALQDDLITDIPAQFERVAENLSAGRRGGEPPFAFLAWLLDNNKEGSMGAATAMKAISERREWNKALLGPAYIDPTNIEAMVKRFAPQGYTTWQPEEGKLMFTAKTIPEHIADAMIAQLRAVPGIDGAIFANVLEQAKSALVVGGDKYQMVIPEELAATLNQLRDPVTESFVDEVLTVPTRLWKQWVLINPRRVLKYNINNLSGDLDAIFAGNPHSLTRVGEAAKELYAVMRKDAKPSARYQEAVDRGVFDSGLTIQEVPEINALSRFASLTDKSMRPDKVTMRALSTVWNGLKGFTQWRENVFRYAAYLDYVDRIEAGESMDKIGYGASLPAMVDAVSDVKDRAALLARDLVGDYGDVSQNGRWLRNRLLPFYSWMEINTRRYWRLTRNAGSQGIGKGIATGTALAAAAGARRSAWLAIRMAMVYGLIQAWNNLLFGDDEEKLSEEQQRQLHILLGTWNDEIVSLRVQGAASDALGWFGIGDAVGAISEVEKGRGSVLDVVKAVAKAPVQKVAGGITPMLTQPIEAATGKKLWPDVFNPRPIRDGWRNFFSTFSLENEYDAARGKPTRGYASSWMGAITYSRDPGEMAYDEARGIAYDWLKREKGQDSGTFSTTPRAEAMYDYKKALRFGDTEAADAALDKMIELGMDQGDLAASIKRASPLGPIAKKDRAAFVQSLTDEEFKKLEAADEWYRKTYL